MSSTTTVGDWSSSRSIRGAPKTASVPIGSRKISWREDRPGAARQADPEVARGAAADVAARRPRARPGAAVELVEGDAPPAQLGQRGRLHPLVGEVHAHHHALVGSRCRRSSPAPPGPRSRSPCGRAGPAAASAAWPTRGMMKKSPPASAKVIAAATRLTRVSGPRKKTRRVAEPAAPSRPACSSSVTTWLRISIQVPSTRKTDEHRQEAQAEADRGGRHQHEERQQRGVAQVPQAAPHEEAQEDEEQQQVHHPVQQRVGEVEEIDRDRHRRGADQAVAERRAHRPARRAPARGPSPPGWRAPRAPRPPDR